MWDARIYSFVELTGTPSGRGDTGHGALSGLAVGVKDIIDVAGLPTRNGSETYRDADPAAEDAIVVAALRAAGAEIAGKTATTEFAFTDPTNCRNPFDIRRSPGGSSSGSGAAVAAGLVDVALGTQTAGSLCRPAAYCGAVGFKPSYGVLSTAGVTPLAPSFDTVGIISRSVDLASWAFRAMASVAASADLVEVAHLVAASALWPTDVTPTNEVGCAFRNATQGMEQLVCRLGDLALMADIDGIVQHHRTIMTHEAASAHGHLLSGDRADLLQPKFRAGLQAGAAVSPAEAETSAGVLRDAKRRFWADLADVDVVLTLPVPEGAPLIDGTTGFQDWLTPWTVFGGPLVCLPWGLDSLGRPLSVMLAGHPGQDATLLNMAAALERLAPALPRPKLPVA
jgi:Asp-tRNA(Asn)/Glu-tRNA(Gln) amidotransferase A subunit family amidase